MPCRLPLSQSALVLREIRTHFILGSACFVLLAIVALATNYVGLRTLVLTTPHQAAIIMLGAATSFAPLIIAIAIGSVRRGEQNMKTPRLDD